MICFSDLELPSPNICMGPLLPCSREIFQLIITVFKTKIIYSALTLPKHHLFYFLLYHFKSNIYFIFILFIDCLH